MITKAVPPHELLRTEICILSRFTMRVTRMPISPLPLSPYVAYIRRVSVTKLIMQSALFPYCYVPHFSGATNKTLFILRTWRNMSERL